MSMIIEWVGGWKGGWSWRVRDVAKDFDANFFQFDFSVSLVSHISETSLFTIKILDYKNVYNHITFLV